MIDKKFKLLILVLVVVLIINTVLHFTHPAYKYYTDNVRQFRSDYNDFVRQVRSDFIPTILQVSSNRYQRVETSSSSSNVVVETSSSSSSVIPTSVDARYFSANGDGYFCFNGWTFKKGDDFYGYTILDVRPTLIITDGRVFLISSDRSDKSTGVPQSSKFPFPK